MIQRLFVDSNVLLLAAGSDHAMRDACRRVIAAAMDPGFEVHVSAEALQEFCFHRLRRSDRAAAVGATRILSESLLVHDFDRPIVARMLDLLESTSLRGRDAVHAATALEHGFDSIVTADADFEGVPGLTRIAPEDAFTRQG